MMHAVSDFSITDELTQIVKDEMDRNMNLSKDLQMLRTATAAIETVQNDKNHEQVCVLFYVVGIFFHRVQQIFYGFNIIYLVFSF